MGGIAVVPIIAATGSGIDELIRVIGHQLEHKMVAAPLWRHEQSIQQATNTLTSFLQKNQTNPRWIAVRALEGEWDGCMAIPVQSRRQLEECARQLRSDIEQEQGHPIDVLIANSRYQAIQTIVQQAMTQKDVGTS